MNNTYYNQALEEAKRFHNQPEGLSTKSPTIKSDNTIIKQHNTIIILLLKILQNLEKLTKSNSKSDIDIDEIIHGIQNLEISKPRPISRIPKSYTFGSLETLKKDKEVKK